MTKLKAKTKEILLTGVVSLVVSVITALITSNIVVTTKLADEDRIKLNQNFKHMTAFVEKVKTQEFITILLLSKLIHTRKDWRPEDFQEARDLLQDLKKNSDFNFDAIVMDASDVKNQPCENFREFYKKNREMIKTNQSQYLKSKIDHCIPKGEQ